LHHRVHAIEQRPGLVRVHTTGTVTEPRHTNATTTEAPRKNDGVIETRHTSNTVTKPLHTGDTTIQARRTNNTVIEARQAIIALPPGAVSGIDFDPALPVNRHCWLAHSPMGRVAKIHAVYDTPFWRDAGLSGIATLYDDGPVGVVFDNSPVDGARGVLVAFVYGDRLSDWSALPADGRRITVLAALAKVVGSTAHRPVDYTEKIWSLDRFVHGGYEAFVQPGGWLGYGRTGWRAPTGAIHWAGTETASTWNGYIDGAISSGYRAADEVARGCA
jgi:monoamine oxidase